MATAYLPVVEDGAVLFYVEVEVTRATGSQPTSGLGGRVLAEMPQAFEQLQRSLKNAVAAAVRAVHEVDTYLQPDEFEVEVALKLTAEGNVVLTKASGESLFSVRMTYRKQGTPASDGNGHKRRGGEA